MATLAFVVEPIATIKREVLSLEYLLFSDVRKKLRFQYSVFAVSVVVIYFHENF